MTIKFKAMKLWEQTEAQSGCPAAGNEHRFTNWTELREHASGYHDHLNVVVWWRWHGSDDPNDVNEFSVTVALPGREKMCEWVAPVTRSQEPEIRHWLDERFTSLMALWYPVPFEALA